MFFILLIVFMIKLVNVIGSAVGIVPDELFRFEKLSGF